MIMKPKSEREFAASLALLMYANEPCRICRKTITVADLHDIVFAGYGKDCRSAHKQCWESLKRHHGSSERVKLFLDDLDTKGLSLKPVHASFVEGKRRARRMRHSIRFAIA